MYPNPAGVNQGQIINHNSAADPKFPFRDTSLDHFKIKLGMTTNQDGSVEIRVEKAMVSIIRL